MERVELGDAPEIATIEITDPLPESGVADSTYKIKGSAKIFDAIGAPPWVYAEVRKKEWYKPEAAEEVSYERGFPMPITGEFTIEFKPDKEADYEVTLLATPAPLSLPVIGVFPVVGRSDTMKIAVGERPPAVFRFSGVRIDENDVALTDHDADSGLLLEKTTADYLDITPAFEWTGPSKKVTVSIKVGYRDWLGAFSPKTGAYTRTFTLPESPAVPYAGELESPIRIPLTAAGGITDGAIEMVLKIAGEPDYISRIWNVYATKAPPEALDFDLTRPSVSKTPVDPGTTIDITCPITSRCVKPVDARAKVIIYEGSLLPGHGAKIKEYDSGVFHIEPSESTNVVVHHTAVKGTIDRRDVEVEVYIGTQLVKESEWDDVYYVGIPPEEVIDFNLTKPSVSPAEIAPGTAITITCPVTSACTKEQTATAKVLIYEGSIFAGHGTLIATKTSPAFSIAPGQTYNVNVHHTAIAGTIDRRDIEVEIYVGGKLVKESEWDDVYYVKAPTAVPPRADIQNLDFVPTKGTYDIGDRVPFTCSYEYKGKAQRGQLVLSLGTGVYPTFSTVVNYAPMSIDFAEAMDWVRRGFSGTFLLTEALKPGQTYSTRARLETLEDPTQETDTDWGVLTIREAAPKEYTLTASVSPSGTGTVTGAGRYTEGTYATCYANPASGYEFDRWGGDATGITQSVTILMDRDKTVVAYFKKKEVPGYKLTVWVRPLAAGWVTKEPDKDSYDYGEIVQLTARNAPGYKFSYWTSDGEWAGFSTTLTVMVTKDLEVYARFTEV